MNKMKHIVITSIRYNKLNDIVGNALKIDNNYSIAISIINPQPLVKFSLRGGKNSRFLYIFCNKIPVVYLNF